MEAVDCPPLKFRRTDDFGFDRRLNANESLETLLRRGNEGSVQHGKITDESPS
jgi:hypothetical protein